jgi:hypothetical protein
MGIIIIVVLTNYPGEPFDYSRIDCEPTGPTGTTSDGVKSEEISTGKRTLLPLEGVFMP